jgi:hypothetical protein
MTTVKHPHAKSNAAKIRKLILQGELSNKVIADKVSCPVSYVYAVRMNMKKKVGIASLPSVTDVATPSADFMFAMSQGKRGPGRPRKVIVAPHPAMNAFIPEHELAEAMGKMEDDRVERKHLKQSFMAIVAMALLLAAVLAYTFTK